jgi:hypothetical protein
MLCKPTLTLGAACLTIAGAPEDGQPEMPNHSRPYPALGPNPRREHSRWLVPISIGILGIITVALILVALGVLMGLVRF